MSDITTAGPRHSPPVEPVADSPLDVPSSERDPQWFRRAVFYEVFARSFHDANGDGVGDLRGLTERLDYLQWLGIDCVWLPPFLDRKSTRLNSSHLRTSRMPSSA